MLTKFFKIKIINALVILFTLASPISSCNKSAVSQKMMGQEQQSAFNFEVSKNIDGYKEIFTICDPTIKPENLSLEAMNKYAQDNFLGALGSAGKKERWELETKPILESRQSELIPILRKLGYVDKVVPCDLLYDFVFIHGAAVATMQKRVAFLIQECLGVLKSDSVVYFLSGARPLQETEIFERHRLGKNQN